MSKLSQLLVLLLRQPSGQKMVIVTSHSCGQIIMSVSSQRMVYGPKCGKVIEFVENIAEMRTASFFNQLGAILGCLLNQAVSKIS